MNKFFLGISIAVLVVCFSLVGCATKTLVSASETETEVVVIIEDVMEEAVEEEIEEPKEETLKEEVSIEGKIKSKLSGMYYEEEKLDRRPVVVMFDNHIAARPQSGLSSAEVMYEILAEGSITRYMGVFYGENSDFVGPIRSARSYFIDKALEYDPMYAHVGGSPGAFNDLVRLSVADLDGLAGNGMYRSSKTNKKAPHNTYSSIEALRESGLRKNYRSEGKFEFFDFYEEDSSIGGETCDYVKLTYKRSSNSDKVGYFTEYKYDEDTNAYYRFVNGKNHIDSNNGENLMAKNIIIQFASHKVIDDAGRLDVKTVGSGTGYLISNGEKKSVTWEKSDRRDKTSFYDSDGNEITLNSGVTWFQVISDQSKIGWW